MSGEKYRRWTAAVRAAMHAEGEVRNGRLTSAEQARRLGDVADQLFFEAMKEMHGQVSTALSDVARTSDAPRHEELMQTGLALIRSLRFSRKGERPEIERALTDFIARLTDDAMALDWLENRASLRTTDAQGERTLISLSFEPRFSLREFIAQERGRTNGIGDDESG